MANIQDISEEQKPKLTPQEEEELIVKDIAKLSAEYNASLEVLSDVETAASDAETELYKFVMKMYKKSGQIDPEYDTLYTEFVERKQLVLQKQTLSFKIIQKLRSSQTNYLAAVINALQARLSESAKVTDNKVVDVPMEPVAGPSTNAAPAVSSRGRLA